MDQRVLLLNDTEQAMLLFLIGQALGVLDVNVVAPTPEGRQVMEVIAKKIVDAHTLVET